MKRIVFAVFIILVSSLASYADDEQNADSTLLMNGGKTRELLLANARDYEPCLHRNLFVELGGPSMGIIGLGYDSRFKPGSIFGYRVGVSFANGSYENNLDGKYLNFIGVNFPLEANIILGFRKSKFELGIGFVPAILHRELSEYHYRLITDTDSYFWYEGYYEMKNSTNINATPFMNIGYRYQRNSGFFMRVGLTLFMGELKWSPIDGMLLLPNISFGYTLP